MGEWGSLAGLQIASDIPLIGVAPLDVSLAGMPAAAGQLRIRRVSRDEISARARSQAQAIPLEPGQPGSFLITGPEEILVAPAPGAAERSLFAYLFGPCFAAIAYLNRILPLHASAIDTPQGCVGFIGRSGAGKSTTVGALTRRGYSIHSDDVCLIRRGPDDRILSWPGIRWLRLTREAAAALEYADASDIPRGRKHSLPLAPLAEPFAPRRVRALYVLDECAEEEAEPAGITRLHGARAAECVIANAYRPGLARRLDLWPRVVRDCIALAAGTPVFLFRRRLGFEHMEELLDCLESHLRSISLTDIAA
jgi:hypothetical protein